MEMQWSIDWSGRARQGSSESIAFGSSWMVGSGTGDSITSPTSAVHVHAHVLNAIPAIAQFMW